MWLERAAASNPGGVAVQTPEMAVSYAELLQRARALEPEPFALADGSLGFVAALHACLLARVPFVPLDPRLSEAERERRRELARPAATSPGTALVLFTSGTTAEPRHVELSAANFEAAAAGSAHAIGIDPRERWLCALPLAHVGGLSILVRSAIYGTTAVLHPRFDAAAVLRALRDDGITVVSLVPTMLARLLDLGLERPPVLRCALLGGAPAPPALLERARRAGVPVSQTYGLTEACSQVTTSPAGEAETAGPPLPGVRVEIAADGEILVAGPTVARTGLAADGWLHTGDLGVLNARGRLIVTGRKADTIVSGGENIAPTEVEAVLIEHSGVADAGVYGRPDAEWGEAVVAAVVLRAGATVSAEALREHCAGSLARFKVPKDIRFVSQLPRTPSGKLLRRVLTD